MFFLKKPSLVVEIWSSSGGECFAGLQFVCSWCMLLHELWHVEYQSQYFPEDQQVARR